ncbi:MAG TPA: multicopper oxidase domain-containing protein, partial [Vicinamibacterales bacterium]|nr:multicopper oxidase domain-containing protein [Vicinamibacterales bacterium]
MPLDRRDLLKLGIAAALAPRAPIAAAGLPIARARQDRRADYTIRIAPGLVELAPDHIISTTVYNGGFPGPMLRFHEGTPITIDIVNDSDTPEQLHW